MKLCFSYLLVMAAITTIAMGEIHISRREAQRHNPFVANERNLSVGKAVYQRHCLDCHGPSGRGDGRRAHELDPKPADLSAARVNEATDGRLFAALSRGEPPMPDFSRLVSEDDRWLVLLYVRTFGDQHHNHSADTQQPTAKTAGTR